MRNGTFVSTDILSCAAGRNLATGYQRGASTTKLTSQIYCKYIRVRCEKLTLSSWHLRGQLNHEEGDYPFIIRWVCNEHSDWLIDKFDYLTRSLPVILCSLFGR